MRWPRFFRGLDIDQRQVFAVVPHYCYDIDRWVWLEPVWKTWASGSWDGGWNYTKGRL